MLDASLSAFSQRRNRYFAHAADAALEWYDADGQWIAPTLPAATRERFWLAFSLYAMDNCRLADAVVRQGESPSYHGITYNIFDTNIAAALLVSHRERMADDVRGKLEALVRDGFCFKPGNRQPDYQFHGYNDNMPAKGTMGLILGGDLLDEPAAVDYGIWDLHQLRSMLTRRGINSEYNSPTYTALTLHALGEIAEHAQHPEARELARGIEERLWIDLAARFHPETGVIAGPYSRAYTCDTIALGSCINALLWFTLGDCVHPSPMLLFDPADSYVVHHMNDYPFNIAQMCWYAGGSFHIPEQALELFTRKSYPFRAVATAEMGDAGPDFPARPARLESFLQQDYTQGTVTTPFCGGEQTMSWFVTYRRQAPVASFRDVGTVFTKLLVDDEVPGEITGPGPEWSNTGEADHTHSYANTYAVQSGATALVVTHPHLKLGGDADTGSGAKAIRKLSEAVIFPTHWDASFELIVAGQRRETWSGEVPRGSWIVCRRGRLLSGIRPLTYTHELGEPRLTLERLPRYDLIRATFHEGEARTFTRQELRLVHGGFIAEVASVDDFASLEAFSEALAQARFTDYYFTTRRVRYQRPALADREAIDIELSWSPGTHTPRYLTINGALPDWSPVQIDGVATTALPFATPPAAPVPPFFPWQDLTVEWAPWPNAINDREI